MDTLPAIRLAPPHPFDAVLPLDDLSVTKAEDEEHAGMIELATFAEGEFVESIFVTRERAEQILFELAEELGIIVIEPAVGDE